MKKLFASLLLIVLPSMLSQSLRAFECLDEKTQLPKGSYTEKHCNENVCLWGSFHYDAAKDHLEITRLHLEFTFESFRHESHHDFTQFPDTPHVPNVCEAVLLGFDLAMHANQHDDVTFMLVPPQPKSALPTEDKGEHSDELKAFEQMLERKSDDSYHKSCKKVRFYEKEDLLIARCPRADRQDVSVLIPYLYQFYNQSDRPLKIANHDGVLKLFELYFIRNKEFERAVDMSAFVDKQCLSSSQTLVPVSSGYTCETSDSDLISENLNNQKNVTVVINRQQDYSLLIKDDATNEALFLAGTNLCFKHGLTLGYLPEHDQLYCLPQLVNCPAHDREEL